MGYLHGIKKIAMKINQFEIGYHLCETKDPVYLPVDYMDN